MLGDLLEQRLALVAMQRQYAQLRGEARRFVLPVGYQAGGHDDQCWIFQAPGLFLAEDVRQGLQGLAQAHVVGQYATDAQFGQGLHPVQALHLIGAQFGLQTLGWRNFTYRQVLQALGEAAQFIAALPTEFGPLGQFGQACGIGTAQAQRQMIVARVAEIQLAERGQQRLQSGEGQGDAFAALRQVDQQAVFIGALGQRFGRQQPGRAANGLEQDRQQAQALAFDFDAQLQVEPVLLRVFLDLGVPVVDLGEVVLEVRAHVDLPAFGAQLRQLLLDEIQPVALALQLERLAGIGRQRFALAQGNLQAEAFQALAQGGFGSTVADQAQVGLCIQALDQVLGRLTEDLVSGIVEGQRRAVLGLLLHAPLARIEMHAHLAAQAEDGGRRDTFQARFRQFLVDHDDVRQVAACALLRFQGEQGGGHMLAVETHRAGAVPGHAPFAPIGVQGNALLVGLPTGATAVGEQAVVLDAEQLAAFLFGVADTATQVTGAEFRAPVFLAELVNIQRHQRSPVAKRNGRMTGPWQCKATDSRIAA